VFDAVPRAATLEVPPAVLNVLAAAVIVTTELVDPVRGEALPATAAGMLTTAKLLVAEPTTAAAATASATPTRAYREVLPVVSDMFGILLHEKGTGPGGPRSKYLSAGGQGC
jgi:hypothetical protein